MEQNIIAAYQSTINELSIEIGQLKLIKTSLANELNNMEMEIEELKKENEELKKGDKKDARPTTNK